jgi:hypothetical protein
MTIGIRIAVPEPEHDFFTRFQEWILLKGKDAVIGAGGIMQAFMPAVFCRYLVHPDEENKKSI